MAFCESGARGLEELSKASYDIVISDKKMPGMSGSEFLALVTHLHPEVIRMVLSGYSELEPELDALGRPHFSLCKPCNIEVVHRTIETALAAKLAPVANSVPPQRQPLSLSLSRP